jgi:hypothetical protein
MIFPCFLTFLVPMVGAAVLMAPGLDAAGEAAIVLTSVTARTEIEHRSTFTTQANPLPENQFTLSRRASSRAGLDNGNGFVSL